MKKTVGITGVFCLCIGIWLSMSFTDQENEHADQAKIALREVGHHLLQHNQDSTSLVLPIKQVNQSSYLLRFENELAILPDTLVSLVERSLAKVGVVSGFRISVFNCSDGEVAYSYQVRLHTQEGLVPCGQRGLPEQCYTVKLTFISSSASLLGSPLVLSGIFTLSLGFLLFFFIPKKKEGKEIQPAEGYTAIGQYQFYPAQNKLLIGSHEEKLSNKECELLLLFAAHPNQLIKRDELTKKVWEDHGVFVGRSLDTYISKLRKKLVMDEDVKISNAHGIGYCLEIESN